METIEAELVSTGEEYFIQINDEPKICISISEENANVVKSAFNALIRRLRNGPFEISLSSTEKGLFYHVAKEYIDQLNREMRELYEEMKQHGLTKEEVEER